MREKLGDILNTHGEYLAKIEKNSITYSKESLSQNVEISAGYFLDNDQSAGINSAARANFNASPTKKGVRPLAIVQFQP